MSIRTLSSIRGDGISSRPIYEVANYVETLIKLQVVCFWNHTKIIPKSVLVCDIPDFPDRTLVWASDDLCRLLTYGVFRCMNMSSLMYSSLPFKSRPCLSFKNFTCTDLRSTKFLVYRFPDSL